MQKGAVMVYGWKADSKVAFEFHGEPDQKPNQDYFESYELDDKVGKDAAYGSFTAPSTGIHGWFWQKDYMPRRRGPPNSYGLCQIDRHTRH
jgi:hypothetical protein